MAIWHRASRLRPNKSAAEKVGTRSSDFFQLVLREDCAFAYGFASTKSDRFMLRRHEHTRASCLCQACAFERAARRDEQ